MGFTPSMQNSKLIEFKPSPPALYGPLITSAGTCPCQQQPWGKGVDEQVMLSIQDLEAEEEEQEGAEREVMEL